MLVSLPEKLTALHMHVVFSVFSVESLIVFLHPLRYCVLLITGEDETFVSVNDAFFDFASSNTKEVLRFAYVYQRQQQPLCDTLLKKEDMRPPQVRVKRTYTHRSVCF